MEKLTICYLYEFKDGQIAWCNHCTNYKTYQEFLDKEWNLYHTKYDDKLLAWCLGNCWGKQYENVNICLPMTDERAHALKFFGYMK